MESANRSTAAERSFWLDASVFSGAVTVVLEVLHRGVDAYLVAEFGVLAPDHGIGAAELRDAAKRSRDLVDSGDDIAGRENT